ncbi:MAG: Hint domain-containing protein [Minisyncoccia bacterium]
MSRDSWNDPSSSDYWGGPDSDWPRGGRGGKVYKCSDPNCWKCNCFPQSTLIETPRGRTQIGNLSEGQTILSYTSDGALVARAITRKLAYNPTPLIQVAFESEGGTLQCAVSHSFLTNKGYQSLRKLRPGDFITRVIDSRIVHSRIESITSTGTAEPVFNLYTQGEHNFIADGCVAHNFTHFRMLRVALHRLFFDSFVLQKDDASLAL